MVKIRQRHAMDSVFSLLVFAVFTACILLVLLLGVRSYQKVEEAGGEAFDRRIGLHYIQAKLRRNDRAAGVEAGPFSPQYPQIQSLLLHEDLEGTDYTTRIYFYDGYIRELFSETGLELDPEAGQQVLAAGGLELELENGLLNVVCLDEQGLSSQLWLSLRGGEEDRL